ncbi:MAG: nucleoside triphosphate pyrophosphohydrolase [Spirochaetota bacterium]|nr:nucleoside triphosphate pyrophosphohydrolase [Spirochaetota bacterium]
MELKENEPLYKLKELASILRSENGCAWDKAQTSQTLKPYLIEEAYEVYDAIDKDNKDELKEELGDLLYQVYAHAQIASEQMSFNIDDIANSIITKLIRRHPHVFGNSKMDSPTEVIKKWEEIKKSEKPERLSVLEGVPKNLPSLLKAYRIQQKVSNVGFDWDKIDDVINKLDEETTEFKEAITSNDKESIFEEMGDILFTLANISRFLGINPEEALSKTIDKFVRRFQYVEKETANSAKSINDMSLEELDDIWERAKEGKVEDLK